MWSRQRQEREREERERDVLIRRRKDDLQTSPRLRLLLTPLPPVLHPPLAPHPHHPLRLPRLSPTLSLLPLPSSSPPPPHPPFCRLSDAAPTPRGFSLTSTILPLLQRNRPLRRRRRRAGRGRGGKRKRKGGTKHTHKKKTKNELKQSHFPLVRFNVPRLQLEKRKIRKISSAAV